MQSFPTRGRTMPEVTESLTAELLLLTHDDDTGKPLVSAQKRRVVTAGAAITELALAGALDLEDAQPARRAKLRAVPGVAPPSPALEEALERADGYKPKDAIARIGGVQDFPLRADAIRDAVMGELATEGIVDAVEPRALRLIGPRWPLRRPDVVAALKERIVAVLDGADPGPRTASLVAIAHGGGLLPQILPGRDRKADAKRAVEIAETEWHGEAVTKAIAEINTVMMSAIIVPVVVTGGGGG